MKGLNTCVRNRCQVFFCPLSLAEPCTVTADDMRHQNIAFKYRDANKMYSTHNDVIEFRCTKGQPVNNVGLRQKCNDGVLLLPSCQ